MPINLKILSKDNALLLTKIDRGGEQILFAHNINKSFEAASLIKIFYALETLRRVELGFIKDDPIEIKPEMVSHYGTDVLGDIVGDNNSVFLDVSTLVGLMIKYSCNSSSNILLKSFLPDRKELEKIAHDVWKLKNLKLLDDSSEIKKITLADLFKLYWWIYGPKPILKETNELLKEKLKTSRNIYYLFDQLEVMVLGSKSGTLSREGCTWIGDSGVVEIKGKRYFIGAISKRKHISEAVLQVRAFGKSCVEYLRYGESK